MGYVQDRDDRRVRGGEEIIAVIEEALRWRNLDVLHPDGRATSEPYRNAMMGLLSAFEQLAREEISQRETDLSYDG